MKLYTWLVAFMQHTLDTICLLPEEEARMIPGMPAYAATSMGRIFSLNARRVRPSEIHGTAYGRGYRNVTIKQRSHYVHRLVALAFHGVPSVNTPYACHNDGNPGNNKPSNLRWDSQRGNLADCEGHGTLQHGERHYAARIADAAVVEMREAYAAGVATISDLAARFSITRSGVALILKGKSRRKAGGPTQQGSLHGR